MYYLSAFHCNSGCTNAPQRNMYTACLVCVHEISQNMHERSTSLLPRAVIWTSWKGFAVSHIELIHQYKLLQTRHWNQINANKIDERSWLCIIWTKERISYRSFKWVCIGVNWQVPVKFTLQFAMKAKTGRRWQLYSFFNLGARWGWMVNATSRPLYSSVRKKEKKTRYPLYRRLGGPQGRSGRMRKTSPHQRSIPGPPSQLTCMFVSKLQTVTAYLLRKRPDTVGLPVKRRLSKRH